MTTSEQVLEWALHAETESEREFYWELYEQVCDAIIQASK